MTITLYVRTYPVKGAPVTPSLVPFAPGPRYTYTRDGEVYDAVSREVRVTVPDGSVLDAGRKLLCWGGDTGPVKSTGREVYELARTRAAGFGRSP